MSISPRLSLEMQVLLGPVEYVDLSNALPSLFLQRTLKPVEREQGKFLLMPAIQMDLFGATQLQELQLLSSLTLTPSGWK